MRIFNEFDAILAGTRSRTLRPVSVAEKPTKTIGISNKPLFASAIKTRAIVSSIRRDFIESMRKKGMNAIFASVESEFARKTYGQGKEFNGVFTPGVLYSLDEISQVIGSEFPRHRPIGIKVSADESMICVFEVYCRTTKSVGEVINDSLKEAETYFGEDPDYFDDWYDANDNIYYHGGIGKQDEKSRYKDPDNLTYQSVYNAKANKARIHVFASVDAITGYKPKKRKNKFTHKEVTYQGYKVGRLYMYIGEVIPITTRADFDDGKGRYNGKLQFRYRPKDRETFASNYTDMLHENERLNFFLDEDAKAGDEAAKYLDEADVKMITDRILNEFASAAMAEKDKEYDRPNYDARVVERWDGTKQSFWLDGSWYNEDSIRRKVQSGTFDTLEKKVKRLMGRTK